MAKVRGSQKDKSVAFAAWGERCALCRLAPPNDLYDFDFTTTRARAVLPLCPSCAIDAETDVMSAEDEVELRLAITAAAQAKAPQAAPARQMWMTGAEGALAHLVFDRDRLQPFSAFAVGRRFVADPRLGDTWLQRPCREARLHEVGKQRRHLEGLQMTLTRKAEKIRHVPWSFVLGPHRVEAQVSARQCILVNIGAAAAPLPRLDPLHPTRTASGISARLAALLNDYPTAFGLFPTSVALYRPEPVGSALLP